MCGISGGMFLKSPRENLSLIENITSFQKNRGPDFQKVEQIRKTNPEVIVAHNRLSILDLSASAHQPFWDDTKRYVLTFNGCIYNYKEIREDLKKKGHVFHTHSDTEVLLKAYIEYKDACVSHFNGFFAFCIYDTVENTFFLARDRFGIKPLFYYRDDKTFCFSSTSNVIANHFGLLPNLTYLQGSFKAIHVGDGTEATAYLGLNYLKPGHTGVVSIKKGEINFQTQPYYNFVERVKSLRSKLTGINDETLHDEISTLVKDSVNLRMRSDVDVGLSLSGGLDSSLIAVLSSEKGHKKLHCVTYASKDESGSEASVIDRFNEAYALPIEWVTKDLSNLIEEFPTLIDLQDAPFESMSIYNQFSVFRRARESGLKVMLGGQGADEAFLGYKGYQVRYLSKIIKDRNLSQVARVLYDMAPSVYGDPGFWLVNTLKKIGSNSHKPSLFDAHEQGGATENYPFDSCEFNCQQITQALSSLLRYEDRNSAGNSIESRLPFMDYRLIELACALPAEKKIGEGFGKLCLRKVSKGYVPDFIRLARYKRGFDAFQYSRWIKEGLGSTLRNMVDVEKCAAYLNQPLDLDDSFKDDALVKNPRAFYDLTSLIWMSRRL